MKYFLALFIVILFIFSLWLRFYRLGSLPLALSNDEISIAYDSYSLLKTGKDSHGVLFPIAFASLGNAKAPAYAYLLVPFIKFFGNSDLSARLPSAISGAISIICIFLIARQLSNNSLVGIFAGLILALAPWHIVFSRMALESNLALMFLGLGLLLSLKRKFVLSGLFFALSLYSYHSEWLLVPLLLLFLPHKHHRLVITFFVAVIPLVLANIFLPSSVSRQSGTETLLHAYGASLAAIKVFAHNYLEYINPGYLFFSGMGMYPAPHPYESGLLYWPLIVPFAIGLSNFRKYKFLLAWTAVSPIVSSFTPGTPNSRRDLVSLLPYVIWVAMGAQQIYRQRKFLFICLASLTGYAAVLFASSYFYFVPPIQANSYPPFRLIANYLASHSPYFKTALVDFRYGESGQFTGVPHLYLKYYSRDRINFSISRINWDNPNLIIAPGVYYIVPASNPPPAATQLQLVHQFFNIDNRLSDEVWALPIK